MRLGAAEALFVGLIGMALGLGLFALLSPVLTGGVSGGWPAYVLPVVAGLSLALVAVLLPTYPSLDQITPVLAVSTVWIAGATL